MVWTELRMWLTYALLCCVAGLIEGTGSMQCRALGGGDGSISPSPLPQHKSSQYR